MSDYIPPELIPNILARLPIGDVLRCTTVCRSWYNLITSSSFISSHLNSSISNTQPRILVSFFKEVNDRRRRYFLHLDNQTFDEIQEFEYPRTSGFVYGSSNGLFCCADGKRFILWNPSLRKSLFLPNPRFMNLSSDVAFGFLPSTNIYKIVKISYPNYSDGIEVPPEVEIYDCCTCSWRDVDAEFSYVLDQYNNYPAVLNGIVHWTACNVGGTFVRLIATFELGSETFGDLMLPKSLQNEERDILSVSMLKDSICLICREDEFTSIFVMREYGIEESWEKLFNFDSNLELLYFRENGEILSNSSQGFILLDPKTSKDLVSYDPKTSKVMDLGLHKGSRSFAAYAFVDSLFLIQDSNSQG